MKKFIATLSITTCLLLAALFLFPHFDKTETADAAAEGSPSYTTAISSTGVLVGTNSTLVVGTSTARIYVAIANISGGAIYCNMNTSSLGISAPASSFSGITIFASSTYTISPEHYNTYKGPIFCISPVGSASTTVYQR